MSAMSKSEQMSRVRTKNTTPEVLVRAALHRAGLRFRLHAKHLQGTPDIVLPRYGAVVCVHGCFWHQHSGCPRATLPKTNRAFWKRKLATNVRKDRAVKRALNADGWVVFEFWECNARDERRLMKLVSAIQSLRRIG